MTALFCVEGFSEGMHVFIVARMASSCNCRHLFGLFETGSCDAAHNWSSTLLLGIVAVAMLI